MTKSTFPVSSGAMSSGAVGGVGLQLGGVLLNKKSALALLHSDTGTAAILRNELNAGFLQGPLNSVSNIVGHRGALSVIPFETLDRRQRALRRFRQPRLGPAQQPAGSSNLFDRNHQKSLDTFWIICHDPFSITF